MGVRPIGCLGLLGLLCVRLLGLGTIGCRLLGVGTPGCGAVMGWKCTGNGLRGVGTILDVVPWRRWYHWMWDSRELGLPGVGLCGVGTTGCGAIGILGVGLLGLLNMGLLDVGLLGLLCGGYWDYWVWGYWKLGLLAAGLCGVGTATCGLLRRLNVEPSGLLGVGLLGQLSVVLLGL